MGGQQSSSPRGATHLTESLKHSSAGPTTWKPWFHHPLQYQISMEVLADTDVKACGLKQCRKMS